MLLYIAINRVLWYNKQKQIERRNIMETIPMCETCIYGNKIICTDNIICKKHGVLEDATPCKKYQLDLTKKEVRKKRTIKL